MAFHAKLTFDGQDGIEIQSVKYALHRDVDSKGKPSSGIYGGTIDFTVWSDDTNKYLESMVNEYKPIDGIVTFKKGDEDATLKEVKFTKAYVIGFQESFDLNGTNPMRTDVTISAEILEVGNAKHENEWPVS